MSNFTSCWKLYFGKVIKVFHFFSIVGYNQGGFHPFWDTTEKVFLRCGIRRGFPSLRDIIRNNLRMFNKFSSIVSHSARAFILLYPTQQKNLLHCIKMKQCRMIFLNFKCRSLPSDENLDKFSYLNVPINPWRKLKMKYIASYEKYILLRCGIQPRRNFSLF